MHADFVIYQLPEIAYGVGFVI